MNMFDFIRRNISRIPLSAIVMVGVTVAVALVLSGGDLSQIAEASRRGR